MKREFIYRLGALATACLLSFQMWGCGSSTATTTTTTTASSSLVGANDLVVVSPTAQSSGNASISAGLKSSMVSAGESSDDTLGTLNYTDKLAQLDAIRNATTLEGCFNFQIAPYRSGPHADCYGPTVAMSGSHPDGTIDNSDYTSDPPIFGNNPLPGGDLGLWNDVSMEESTPGNMVDTTEACAATKLNSIFNSATAPIDSALFFQASMQCMMRINSISLPAISDNIDFKPIIDQGLANIPQAPTVSAANFTRIADDSNGKPVYAFSMTMTDSFSFNNQTVSITSEYLFNHSPQNDTNTLYRGRLLMKSTSPQLGNAFTNCSNCSTATIATSAIYSKESDTSINVRVRYAIFGNTPTFSELVDSNGEVDFTKKYDEAGSLPAQECTGTTVTRTTTGWSDDANQLTLNINPQNQAITASAAWQAGRNDCHTRVFNATVTPQTGGVDTGIAYFGYGPDAAKSTGVGVIDGMICNWAGPGLQSFDNKTVSPLAQKQSFSLNTTSGVFEPTDSNIRYAPTNSCSVGSGLFYNAMTGTGGSATVITMDNNNAGGSAVTHNLVSQSDISSNFTMPTITGDFSF